MASKPYCCANWRMPAMSQLCPATPPAPRFSAGGQYHGEPADRELRHIKVQGIWVDVDEVHLGAAVQGGALATKVLGLVHNQSPGPRSSARQAMCSAASALLTAMAW